MPCTDRAAISQPMPSAAAHSTQARVDQTRPTRTATSGPSSCAGAAREQDQRGQGQRVARDRPLQCLEGRVKVPSDRGQGDGDNRGVDPGDRRPQDHRRDYPAALRGAVAEQFAAGRSRQPD